MHVESIGYGAGSRELDGRPSVLRISVGELTNMTEIPSHADSQPDVAELGQTLSTTLQVV
jgi:uncharacterized protein (DUF111 family)